MSRDQDIKADEIIYSENQMIDFTAYFMRWEGYLPSNLQMCIAIWAKYPDKPPIQKGNRPKKERKTFIISDILTITCEYYSIPIEKISTKTSKREVVQARYVSMFISRELTKEALETIGEKIGGKDHATVLHAIKTVKNLCETDTDYRIGVADILAAICDNVPEVSRMAYQLMLKVENGKVD